MHTTNYCLLLQEPRQKHVAGYDVAQWSEVRAYVASTPATNRQVFAEDFPPGNSKP
jgi:hypothetical protein